ncbi:cytochrome P450 monooxygenase [Rhodofomes roseus]|uniref:Cytochrome P450 monooxygenase n=1 Tax=Rhodofomes roseus TaxID=34475 RepID=A0ABQ8KBD0_9APHY|nr:cytochrome P450 monooxygenase [Rhodofomes roseus]KAH9834572.1 cytochrome P450 monooxygenase [Rhodofomes roseus]
MHVKYLSKFSEVSSMRASRTHNAWRVSSQVGERSGTAMSSERHRGAGNDIRTCEGCSPQPHVSHWTSMAMFQVLSSYTLIAPFFLFVIIYSLGRRNSRRLPPGPYGFPLVGNVRETPFEHPEYTFASWAKKYGDLIYNEFFGHRTVIINSQKIAQELLEKRGAKYSSRPRMTMLAEMLGWNPTLTLLPYKAESRRKQRKWIHGTFGEKKSVQGFEGLKKRETYIFVLGLMETPDDYGLHVKRFLAALVLESVYGHRITSLDDEYVTMMDSAMEATTTTGAAGGTLVDMLPFLKHMPAWMPGAGWKRAALRARKLVWQGHHLPYRMAREAIESGGAPPSLLSTLMGDSTKTGQFEQEENDIIYTTGVIYAAATDTTKAALLTFILAMTLHPEVGRKMQEEIDRVIGKHRLPTIEDRPDLPYVDSVLKETYRWHAPLPLGIPHYITEDDEYEGYQLPQDTTIMANMWAICRDERVWNDPTAFRPERFLELDPSEAEALDPRHVVFGYGRRQCPGRLFADTALFLVIATMAATLDIRKARDAEGKEIIPEVSWLPAFISPPEDFVCAIAPRSSSAKTSVADALAGASA